MAPRYYRSELIRRVPESLLRYYRTDPIEYPKITRRLYDTNVMQGRHTWLEVHVTGDPEPHVKWYKNSVPVKESESIKVHIQSIVQLELIVHNILIEYSTLLF